MGGRSTDVVGRDEELRAISSFLEQRPARGGLLIEGEPGIGKTTLWRAAVDAAVEQDWAVLQARPTESEQKLSFSALGDVLGPVVDRLDELAAPRRRALEIALLLDSDAEAAPDPRAVALATLDLLRLVAVDLPLLVAVDDTQWMDPPSRDTPGRRAQRALGRVYADSGRLHRHGPRDRGAVRGREHGSARRHQAGQASELLKGER